MNPEPRIVAVASTMRSGSTLLKALLAEAEDVLNLPETNFQNRSSVDKILKQHSSEEPPIKVLKKPCWYQETKTYPRLLEIEGMKTIALVRDVYDTVTSLRKMTFRKLAGAFSPVVTNWLAGTYWLRVTGNLLTLVRERKTDVSLVKYEELVENPIEETSRLYRFIGSVRNEGTRQYSPPDSFAWRWGSDDGSANIKSLEVQPPRIRKQTDKRLIRIIESNPDIKRLRIELGYLT